MSDAPRCCSERRTAAGGFARCCRVDGHTLPHRAEDGREWVAFRDVAEEFRKDTAELEDTT